MVLALRYYLTTTIFLIDPIALNEDQVSIQNSALDFALKSLLPNAAEWDQKHFFPADTYREAAKLGFGGIYTQPDHGGCGLGRLEASAIFEALAYGDPSFSAYLSIHNMVTWMIDTYINCLFRKTNFTIIKLRKRRAKSTICSFTYNYGGIYTIISSHLYMMFSENGLVLLD